MKIGISKEEILRFHMIAYPIITAAMITMEDILLESLDTPGLFQVTNPLPTFIVGHPWIIVLYILAWTWHFQRAVLKNRSLKRMRSAICLHCLLFAFLKISFVVKQSSILKLKNVNVNTSGTMILYIYKVVGEVCQLWQFVLYTAQLLLTMEKWKRKQGLPYTQFFIWIRLDLCMYLHFLAAVAQLISSALEWILTLKQLDNTKGELPLYWMLMVVLAATAVNCCVLLGAVHQTNVKLLNYYKQTKLGLMVPTTIIFGVVGALKQITSDNIRSKFEEVIVVRLFLVASAIILAMEYYAVYLYRKRFLLKGQDDETMKKDVLKRLKGYLKSVDVPSLRVEIDESDEGFLGEGEFGKVLKGKIHHKKTSLNVAVKFLNAKYISEQDQIMNSLFSEIKILYHLNPGHKHLVKLLGILYNQEQNYVEKNSAFGFVFEYCSKGCLRNCLLEWDKDDQRKNEEVRRKLFCWAGEIAAAMEYLADEKIIHGDLAARNVLLDHKECAKVADFGFSSRLYYYQLYAHSKQTVCPWRWMAPESISDLKFSLKTDVYSYGVLLWEMYALGEMPWGPMQWTSQFVQDLKAGMQLDQPNLAPVEIYDLMKQCWSVDDSKRMSFSEILKTLNDLKQETVSCTIVIENC